MNNWKELSLLKKILIGALIIVAATFAPELMFLIDVGGIDLAFGFLVFYYKPAIEWINKKSLAVKKDLQIAREFILNSALARPKIFALNSIYCGIFLVVTGSVLFSYGLFLPALFITGVYA